MKFASVVGLSYLVASAFGSSPTSSPTSAPTSAPGVVSTFVEKPSLQGTSILFLADITGINVGDQLSLTSTTGKTETNWVAAVKANRRLDAQDRVLGTAGKVQTKNKLQNTYNKGSTVKASTPAPAPPSCFPGEALVRLEEAVSPILLRDLKKGDFVQVQNGNAEEVLGFIHSVAGEANQVSIEHASGEFRASSSHVIFTADGEKTAADIVSGDSLILADGETSRVLSVRGDTTKKGMRAPITTSGAVVVDNTLASNYAVVAKLSIPHSAMHASFFAVRALHQISISLRSVGDEKDEMHALPALYQHVLGLDKMLKLLS